MSSDTTSIMDLPTDPTGGGSVGGNISLSANEKHVTFNQNSMGPGGVSLDQTTINQIVSGLQQASSTGATQLASRDIPRNTENISHDPQIQPNYIPPQSNNDYITEEEENDDIVQNYNKREKQGDSLDQLYEELQIPLLISVLYFLFQLPIFKRYLYKFFPALFSKDGNINLYGFAFTSSLFGMLYYLLSKIMTHLSRF
jgi:hypothetical protein|uniref:Uncharacterized protein n=1 Tax=viral metagenome TaxID=1070528 RepID=A0A6C0D8B7_9ZZZZ